jgi:chromosome segregation ATPase
MHSIACIVAGYLLAVALSCAALVPGYQEELDSLHAQIQSVEAERADLRASAQVAKAQHQAAVDEVAALQAQLAALPADTTPAVVEQLGVTLNALAATRDELAGRVESILAERDALDVRKEELEKAETDHKAEGLGGTIGGLADAAIAIVGMLGLGGTAIGMRATKIANQVKTGPSRGQAEIDSLWETLSEQKAELARLLGRVEAGMAQPTAVTPFVFPGTGNDTGSGSTSTTA